MKRDSRQLKQQMQGRWLAAFQSLAPELTEACGKLGRNVTCPFEGKADGFRLFRDANETGGGVKQNEGTFPEGISLLMALRGWDFVTTFDELSKWLDGGTALRHVALPVTRTECSAVQEDRRRAWLQSMWNEAIPITSPDATPARVYFRSRQILEAAERCRGLRFHPSLVYQSDDRRELGRFPAVLGYVRNNEGLPVAIHRTYLSHTGLKLKLADQPTRKLTPAVRQQSKGRVVRLASVGSVLAVCEGIETALSVMLGTEKILGERIPTWACLSASMMTSFNPPPGVKHVVIFADKDDSKAGELSARRLASMLIKRGINVNVCVPQLSYPVNDKSIDFADLWTREPSGFRRLMGTVPRIAA